MPDRIFENICSQLDLGRLLLPPVRLSGGLMHKMFSLETTRGRYAVKLLNPNVMLRPEAKAILIWLSGWRRFWKRTRFPFCRR